MSITDEGDHLLVRATGEDSYAAAMHMWAAIVDACRIHGCMRVLGVSNLTPLSTMDAYGHAEIFQAVGITPAHKVAWVEENPEAYAMDEFVETVVLNRSLVNGRLFRDVDAAREWLLGD